MYDDKADEYEYEFVNGYAIVKKHFEIITMATKIQYPVPRRRWRRGGYVRHITLMLW